MHLRSFHPVALCRCARLACLAASIPLAAASAQVSSPLPPPAQPGRIVAQGDRVAAHPDFAPLTQLTHQLPAWALSGQQSSARLIDLDTPLKIALVLRRDPAVQAAFEQFLAAQQTPGSPRYHQWLTPQQVGRFFGPTQNDLAAVQTWLTSQGLKIESVSPSGVLVHASGTAATIGNAFHTSFAAFTIDGGLAAAPRISAISEPSIPFALAPLVASIQGLSEIPLRPMVRAAAVQGASGRNPLGVPGAARPQFTIIPSTPGLAPLHYLTPGDFAVIYDINGIYGAGNQGATVGTKTQRIAVIGESRVTDSDITEYEEFTGLPAVLPTVVIPTGAVDPGTTNTGAQDEATLDVDRVIGTAPGAAVDLVVAADTNTASGILEAIEYNTDSLLDPVMTISFGACESVVGQSNVQLVDTLASSGAAEGITTLVSSGDSGVAGCDASFTQAPPVQTASINFLCSSSYVTCVGGTEFNDTADPAAYWSTTNTPTFVSALSYIPEGAWNEPSYFNANKVLVYAPASSGGGASAFIAKPSWQTGTGVPADGFRDVPDVSFSASSHDGYFACLAYAGGDCTQGYFEDFGGTSAAAPGMAGVVALVNTRLGTAAGNINPLLYGLFNGTPAVFHDATVASSGVSGCSTATPSICNNSTPGPSSLSGGLAGFALTAGYDQATGLGSIDVGNLVAVATLGNFTLAASPATLSVTPVASNNGTANTGTTTSTITAASSGGFAGAVALTCAVAPVTSVPPTCTVSPASVTLAAAGTATATLTVTYIGSVSDCPTNAKSNPFHLNGAYGGPAALALLLLLLPLRKRRSVRFLACLVFLITGLASLSGCGGSSSTGSGACSNVLGSGTTPGTYTVTVKGSGGGAAQTTSVAFTVN